MMNGKFYDAGSYKADPVPMALDSGVVYEAFRTGISQGLFTVKTAGEANHNWFAQGTWLPAGAKPPQSTTRRKAEVPKIEDDEGPPRLRRGTEKPASTPPPAAPASTPPPATAPTAPTTTPAAPPANTASAGAPAANSPSAPAPAVAEEEDPNRPMLHRGKPSEAELQKRASEPEKTSPIASSKGQTAGQKAPQLIPAISDAGGPDPRPYTFDLKPGEEATYRAKMLQLASSQFKPAPGSETPAHTSRAKKKATAKVNFEDVQLQIFDLSTSNEPVLVLSANVKSAGPTQEITLIARTDLEGEVQKIFYSQTDAQDLDVAPRMQLIDAVDADGDGRGELLFRTTSDAGSSYAIYRVTPDRLWPLYEGTP